MSAIATDCVQVGTSVRVRGLVPGSETTIHFVPESEADYFRHRLPLNSILGGALAGAEVGDRAALDTFDDQMELEVLEVQPMKQQLVSYGRS
jgi:transcription elongation GreA/GreB family factor